ncbi:hypothetical protein QPK87_01860 [Kamptonema cortianum]|nr:hypothetical protein [Geitlerinema splendidum]MDK3155330.1 hypothetical protein [Kamptonema cortianum]
MKVEKLWKFGLLRGKSEHGRALVASLLRPRADATKVVSFDNASLCPFQKCLYLARELP